MTGLAGRTIPTTTGSHARSASGYSHDPPLGFGKSLYGEGVSVMTLDEMRLPLYYLSGKVLLTTTFALSGGGEEDVDVDVSALAAREIPSLEQMWSTLRESGLMVLGTPVSGEFGADVVDDPQALRSQAHEAGISVPLTEIQVVGGDSPSQGVYSFARRELKDQHPDLIPDGLFHKLLFSRRGKLVGSFDADTDPELVLSHVVQELNTR